MYGLDSLYIGMARVLIAAQTRPLSDGVGIISERLYVVSFNAFLINFTHPASWDTFL